MNYHVLIIGGICLVVGFTIGMLAKKKNDILSCLADFIIFAKQQKKTDEEIHKSIDKITDVMLNGYKDLQQDPKAAYKKLRDDENQTKEMKALIKAGNKLIKKNKKNN
jgi:hypothetical protein